jgi:hypothetical protein
MSIILPPPTELKSETPQIEALSTNWDHWGAIGPFQSNVFSALGQSFRTNQRTSHFQKSNVRRSGAVASEFTYDDDPALPRMSARIIESPDFAPTQIRFGARALAHIAIERSAERGIAAGGASMSQDRNEAIADETRRDGFDPFLDVAGGVGDRPLRVIISGSFAASEVRHLQDCGLPRGDDRVAPTAVIDPHNPLRPMAEIGG